MAKEKSVIVDPEKIKWQPIKELHELPKGTRGEAWAKLLRRDEETGATVVLAKFEKGFHAPKHTHPSDESGIVLEGKVVDEKGTKIKRGMYFFIPAGVEHGPINAPDGCVLFIHSSDPRV